MAQKYGRCAALSFGLVLVGYWLGTYASPLASSGAVVADARDSVSSIRVVEVSPRQASALKTNPTVYELGSVENTLADRDQLFDQGVQTADREAQFVGVFIDPDASWETVDSGSHQHIGDFLSPEQ